MGKCHHTTIDIPEAKGLFTIVHSTWTRNFMWKPRKIYTSDTIFGRNAATTTIVSHRTDQVHRTDSRGTRIHGIHRRIRGRLWWVVDGRYRVPVTHCMEAIMDPRGQIVSNNTEKPKRHAINFRPRYDSLNIGIDGTVRSGDTPQTKTCGNVLRKHANSGMD